MRNLKRALSLALASVMLLGMMVVGTSAADVGDFTDADKISNKEAAAVVAGLGIMAGYTDGSFGADNIVTRAEMATIIVKMLYGSDFNADSFKGIGKFSDVADYQGGWAEGYINVCSNQGIIAGYGDGTFKPGNTVTTAEAVTMIINALGVDAGEGEWPLTVMTKATEMELFGDLVLATNAGLTRDNVAEVVFNGLFYSETTATVTKYALYDITSGSKNIGYFDSYLEAVVAAGVAGLTSGQYTVKEEKVKEYTDSLSDSVFSVVKTEGTVDDFGRPATGYASTSNKYDLDVVIAQKADYTYTTEVTGKTVYNDVGRTACTTYSWSGASAPSRTSTNTWENTSAGLLTEIFVDSNNKTITVTQIPTYLAEVTRVTSNDDKDTLSLKAVTSGMGVSTAEVDKDAFEKGDYVLVTVGNGEAQTVTLANSVNGVMTAYKANDYVKVGNTQYSLTANAKLEDTTDFDGTYTFYLDSYGNVIGSVLYEAGDAALNYVYVSESASQAYSVIDGNAFVKVAANFLDGTKEVVQLAVKNANKSDASFYDPTTAKDKTITTADKDVIAKGFYSYTVNSDGYYTLKALDTDKANQVLPKVATGSTTQIQYARKDATITLTDGNSVAKTLTATSTSKMVLAASGTTYTGYANFAKTDELEITDDTVVLYTLKDNGTVDTIYVLDGKAAESLTFAYYVEQGEKTTDGTYHEFYVNGEYVSYYDDNLAGFTPKAGEVYNLTLDGSEITDAELIEAYDSGSSVKGDTVYRTGGVKMADSKFFQLMDGTIVYYDSDCAIYDVTDKNNIVEVNPADLDENSQIQFAYEVPSTTTDLGKALVVYVIGAAQEDGVVTEYTQSFLEDVLSVSSSDAKGAVDNGWIVIQYDRPACDKIELIVKDENNKTVATYTFDDGSYPAQLRGMLLDPKNDYGTNQSGTPYPAGTYSYTIECDDEVVVAGTFTV